MFGRHHELIVGASYSRSKVDYIGQPSVNFDSTLDNLFTWDGDRAKPLWGDINTDENERASQTGLYATARFKPTDDLAVITGARVVDWRVDRGGFNWSGDLKPQKTAMVGTHTQRNDEPELLVVDDSQVHAE